MCMPRPQCRCWPHKWLPTFFRINSTRDRRGSNQTRIDRHTKWRPKEYKSDRICYYHLSNSLSHHHSTRDDQEEGWGFVVSPIIRFLLFKPPFCVVISPRHPIGTLPIVSQVDPEVGCWPCHYGWSIRVVHMLTKARELETGVPLRRAHSQPLPPCHPPPPSSNLLHHWRSYHSMIWVQHRGGGFTYLLFLLHIDVEWYDNIDANVLLLYLLFPLIINVRINIDKVDHHIIIMNYYHNNHSLCHYSLSLLKLFFYLSFLCHLCMCCHVLRFLP